MHMETYWVTGELGVCVLICIFMNIYSAGYFKACINVTVLFLDILVF